MERIQSAIEKARERRQAHMSIAPEAQPAPPRAVHGPASREAWLAIPEFHPTMRQFQRGRITAHEGGKEATPFDMLRTKVLQQMRANGWRRLAITSPGKDCGKTTVCVNIAFSLSRQADERTLVLELDMRRPSFSQVLGLERARMQFSRVLEAAGAPEDHMVRYHGNLAFGVCRTHVPNPSELLQSETAQLALDELERGLEPTIMIHDMPPMLACDDVLAFAGNVDCVLLVGAAESTTIKELDICERELAARTNVLGVVLNKCRYTDPTYGYYG